MVKKQSNLEVFDLLIKVVGLLGEDYEILHLLFKLLGYDTTLKLLNYFKGQTIVFPSEKVIDFNLLVVKGYILYDIKKQDWNKVVIPNTIGKNATSTERRVFRNAMMKVRNKIKNYDINTTDITESHIDNLILNIKNVRGEQK